MKSIRRKRRINGRRSKTGELLLILTTGISMLTIGIVIGKSINDKEAY